MIEKDDFIRIMERLKTTDRTVNEINGLIRNSEDYRLSDFTNAASLMICHEDIVIEILGKMFDTDMVDYWVYECDYGRAIKSDSVKDENGRNIDITTLDKLYEYIRYGKY